MIDFLAGLVDFAISIVTMIRNTIGSVIWVIVSIPKFASTLAGLVAYCPTPLLVWLEICIAVTIVFAIIKLLK